MIDNGSEVTVDMEHSGKDLQGTAKVGELLSANVSLSRLHRTILVPTAKSGTCQIGINYHTSNFFVTLTLTIYFFRPNAPFVADS